jgi:hypothetical protein
MAHLLLTTTINVQPGETLEVAKGNSIAIPPDFFYNTNASGCQDILQVSTGFYDLSRSR